MPDYIHMVISLSPKLVPFSIVKAFEGGSAKRWFIQFFETKPLLWQNHLWSPSFFMSTLGHVPKKLSVNILIHL
ncbi:transposase [Secundilactobacillus pentosiphilus]|uniref:transposase n=1 Tax=Secundilactobacillus pentosiphilus TaxID=1714682 RepID=UPI0021E7A33F|nr:transposase [Secundilactobacillus pentosiphilus]